MIELTWQEKLEYAKKIRSGFRQKIYDLDFTERFNTRSLIVNPAVKNQVEMLNAQLRSEVVQTRRLIEFLDEDIKQFENRIKLEPLELQLEDKK